MATGGNRPIAPVRRLIAAVLGTVAAFVVVFGLGMTSWAIVALGVAILALAIALATVRGGGRTWVVGIGHVHSTSEPPTQYAFGRCELQLMIDAPGMPPRSKKIVEPRVPVSKWPTVGQALPIRVALDDHRHVRVLWDEVATHTEAAAADLPPEFAVVAAEPVDEMLIQQEAPPWAGRTDDDFRDEFGTDFRDAYHDGFGDQPAVDPILDDPGEHSERRRTVVVHQRPGGPKVVEGTLVEQPSDPTLPRRATPNPRTPSEDPVAPDAALDPPAGERTTTTAAAGLDDAYLDPTDLSPRPRSEQPADTVPDPRPDEPTPPTDTVPDRRPDEPTPPEEPGRPVDAAPPSRPDEPTPPVDAPGPETTPVAVRSEPSPSSDGPARSAESEVGTPKRTDTPTSADPTADSQDPTVGSNDPTVPIDTIVPPTAPAPGQRTDESPTAARTAPPPHATEPSTAARHAPTTGADDPDFDPIDLALDDPAPGREHPDTDSDVGADHLDAAIFGYAPEDPRADSPDLDTGAPIAGVGITVLVTDLGRSLEFYRDVLGFTEVDRGSGNAVLASGTTRLVLREVTEAAPISRRLVHVNLEVNDIQAAYERLRDTGLRFTYAPRVVNRGTKLEVWAAAFRDPDGHGIALTQWRTLTGA